MLRKCADFYQSDGIGNTAKYVVNAIQRECFYHHSVTEFFCCVPDDRTACIATATAEFRTLDSAAVLDAYRYPRLKYLPTQQWLSEGASCYIGLVDGCLVSYCWVHKNRYSLGEIGVFRLKTTEAWIGPVFVDKRFRRRGINTAQIRYAISQEETVSCFFTAISSTNHGSIRSFTKCRFAKVGEIEATTLLSFQIGKVVRSTGELSLADHIA